jgi:hypothetical protein
MWQDNFMAYHMKTRTIIAVIHAFVAVALALPADAQTLPATSPPACTNLSRAKLKKLKGARHGAWGLSEVIEPHDGLVRKIPVAKYRSGQECEREADELRADLCASFVCEDQYGCPLFQPFHSGDQGEIAEGEKAANTARLLEKKLHGKAPGLGSICAGVGGDGFGITEIQVFVLKLTPAVQAAVPKTFGGFPVDIWPNGEGRFL